jgi:hypothetical protein
MTSKQGFSLFVIISALALCAFALRFNPGAIAAAGHANDEQTIRQLNEAHDIADVATLDRIEDADFAISGDFGVVSMQEHLDTVRKRTSNPEVTTRKIDSQRFRFYDNVALVTETDRPTTKDGTFAFQSTEVWVRRGDSWNLAHLHYSQMAESGRETFLDAAKFRGSVERKFRMRFGGKRCLQL